MAFDKAHNNPTYQPYIGGVNRVARLSAGEEEEITRLVAQYIELNVRPRIENDHLRSQAEVNAALDQVKDAAQLVTEVRNELKRYVDLYEALIPRIEQLEAEFGW